MMIILNWLEMKDIYGLIVVMAMVAVLCSCHSTEANYKESYDKAVAASRAVSS